jgi:CHAT domain-containing protein
LSAEHAPRTSPRPGVALAIGGRLLRSAVLLLLGAAPAAAQLIVLDAGGVEGLDPGRRVVGWRLVDRSGEVLAAGPAEDPLALSTSRLAHAPRGSFRLVLDGGAVTGDWLHGTSVEVRPELDERERLLHDRAGSAEEDAAGALYSSLAASLEANGRPAEAAWAHAEAAEAAANAEEAAAAFERARHLVAGRPDLAAELLRHEERSLEERGLPPGPERRELLERALALDRGIEPDGQLVAADLLALAALDANGASPATAEAHCREALRLREAANPESLHTAEALNLLGVAVGQQGRQAEALELAQRRLALVLRIDAPPDELVRGHQFVGALLWKLGRIREAQEQLGIARDLAAATPSVSASMLSTIEQTLSNLEFDRGDFVAAERHARRAVELAEADSDSWNLAVALNSLATIQTERYDYAAADATLARTIGILEEIRPQSRALAMALNNRANNARSTGDLDAALAYVERARAMIFEVAPASLTATNTKAILAQILSARGDYEGAAREMRVALEEARTEFAGSHQVARKAVQLASYLRRTGSWEEARALLGEAVAIYERTSPGVAQHARALHGLGLVDGAQERLSDATRRLCDAVDVVDRQRIGMGADRRGTGAFSREFTGYYHDCAEALAGEDRLEQAFAVVERSRARDLLTLLAERQVSLEETLSAELGERRERLNRRYDDLYERLAGGGDEAGGEALRELEALRREQLDLERAIRAEDPRASSIQLPRTLTLEEALAALEPGTVLLAYSLGESSSRLFVVGQAVGSRHLATAAVEVELAALEALVLEMRDAVALRGDYRVPARRLWDLLIAPAEPWLTGAERLLVSAGGALANLPFAALVDPEGRFLVERLPVHFVSSMTVREELRRAAAAGDRDRLAAFGDPTIGAENRSYRIESVVRSGFDLAPLPESRREIEGIVTLFPDRSEAFLGPAATESRFKAVAAGARRLHVATHGYVDDRSPLDSGLVFSPEGGDEGENGLLQTWEIFEQLRLDADLVTLSACESALGREAAGEGIIGLSRALQYAGARSIVASLWKVADASTADLMIRFYRGLKDGLTKDEALRHAQLALLDRREPGTPERSDAERGVGGLAPARAADARHPYHWAAFQLIGDWR